MECHLDVIPQFPSLDVKFHQGNGFYPPSGNLSSYHPLNIGVNEKCDLTSINYDALDDEDDDDVKRPMNSFLLWAKIKRRKYANENPNLHNAEVSKLLGKIWNSMSNEKKRPYVEQAEKLRVIHMRTYPNYRYAPKKRKEKKGHRMISPEVAAALHSTLFDINNLSSGNTLRPQDLKSFGYLRSLCETKSLQNVDTETFVAENIPYRPMTFSKSFRRSDDDANANTYPSISNIVSLSSSTETCQTDTVPSLPHIDASDLSEEEKVARMTLHYYPKKSNTFDVTSNYHNECNVTQSSIQYDLISSSKATCDINQELADYRNSTDSDIKPDFIDMDFPEFNSNDESINLSCSPYIKPIEEEIPEILQQSFYNPRYSSNRSNMPSNFSIDSSSWWSDIGELINPT